MILLSAGLLSAADGQARQEPKEVRITMGEFWFKTSDSVFVVGVPYRIVLENQGAAGHEWAVVPRGDTDEKRLLTEVEDVQPTATIKRDFTFREPGEYDFVCYRAGHYQGGMVIPVRVRTP